MKDVIYPTSVRVGAIDYEISENDNMDADGQVRYPNSVISLRPGLHTDYKSEVIWHEILHAILVQSGVRHQVPNELVEPLMDCFSYGILQVLRDNPQMRCL